MTNDEMTAEIRDAAKVMAEGVAYIDRLKAEIADLKHELTSAIERAQSERHTAELAEKEAAQDRFRREHLEKALALQAEDIIQEIEKSHQLAREIESLSGTIWPSLMMSGVIRIVKDHHIQMALCFILMTCSPC